MKGKNLKAQYLPYPYPICIAFVGDQNALWIWSSVISHLRGVWQQHCDTYIHRFMFARFCVQHSFFTTVTTNVGPAWVRGNIAYRRAVFWNRRESVNICCDIYMNKRPKTALPVLIKVRWQISEHFLRPEILPKCSELNFFSLEKHLTVCNTCGSKWQVGFGSFLLFLGGVWQQHRGQYKNKRPVEALPFPLNWSM